MKRIGGVFLFLAIVCGGGCSSVADRFLRPPHFPMRESRLQEQRRVMQAQLGDRMRAFAYTSEDHLKLSGLLLLPPAPRQATPEGLVVLLHGLGDSKEGMLPFARSLADNGYVAVVTDLRAHGQSQGRYTTFGFNERQDLRRLLDHLAEMGFDVAHVGVLGGSLGAATAIQWAGSDSRVAALVVVAPFAEMRTEVDYMYSRQAEPPSSLKIRYLESAVQWEGGFKISEVSPLASLGRTAVPMFLMHGQEDQVIPAGESERIFNAARGPVVILRLPSAGHFDVADAAGDEFLRWSQQWIATFASRNAHPDRLPDWAWKLPHRNFPGQGQ